MTFLKRLRRARCWMQWHSFCDILATTMAIFLLWWGCNSHSYFGQHWFLFKAFISHDEYALLCTKFAFDSSIFAIKVSPLSVLYGFHLGLAYLNLFLWTNCLQLFYSCQNFISPCFFRTDLSLSGLLERTWLCEPLWWTTVVERIPGIEAYKLEAKPRKRAYFDEEFICTFVHLRPH